MRHLETPSPFIKSVYIPSVAFPYAFVSLFPLGMGAFPVDLPAHACSRSQIAEFAREAKAIGVEYIGLCCGNASHYIRVVAEEYGRRPPASRFSPDMSQHFLFGIKEADMDTYHRKLRQLVAKHD